MTALDLSALPETLCVCRLPVSVPPPNWALAGSGFVALVRTDDELSVVAPRERVPERARGEDGWRALRVDGQLALSDTGVLASLAAPLAEAGVPMLALSTHDRDYVLVKDEDLGRAAEALNAAGHRFADGVPGTEPATDDEAR